MNDNTVDVHMYIIIHVPCFFILGLRSFGKDFFQLKKQVSHIHCTPFTCTRTCTCTCTCIVYMYMYCIHVQCMYRHHSAYNDIHVCMICYGMWMNKTMMWLNAARQYAYFTLSCWSCGSNCLPAWGLAGTAALHVHVYTHTCTYIHMYLRHNWLVAIDTAGIFCLLYVHVHVLLLP